MLTGRFRTNREIPLITALIKTGDAKDHTGLCHKGPFYIFAELTSVNNTLVWYMKTIAYQKSECVDFISQYEDVADLVLIKQKGRDFFQIEEEDDFSYVVRFTSADLLSELTAEDLL